MPFGFLSDGETIVSSLENIAPASERAEFNFYT